MSNQNNNLIYPSTRRDEDKINVYPGNIQIKDPYHYLEDSSHPETQAFVENQADLLENALGFTKSRAIIESIVSKLNREQANIIYLTRFLGKYLYVLKKPDPGCETENYAKVYCQDLRDGHAIPTVLIDPRDQSLDETEFHFSSDGLYLCYMITLSGGWKNLLFIDLLRGLKCDDILEKVKFTTIGWSKFRDEYGLFYACYPTLKTTGSSSKSSKVKSQSGCLQKLMYHRIGTNQENDITIVDPTDPREMMPSYVTPDGEFLVVLKQVDCSLGNQIYFLKLRPWFEAGKKAKPELVCVVGNSENRFNYITSYGNLVYFHTSHGTNSISSQGGSNRIIGINFKDGQFTNESNWKEIIGHTNGQLCISCIVAHKKYLVALYSNLSTIGSYTVALHTMDGSFIRNYEFDNITISFLNGNYWSSEVFIKVENSSCAGKVYRIDLSRNHDPSQKLRKCCCSSTDIYPLKLFKDFNYPDSENDHFVNYTISCKSKDGTSSIPILLCHDKNLVKNGKAPCLLQVYGSYGYQMSPTFNTRNLAFMKYFDGILAVACVRGGGEFGTKWHESGRGIHKQNSVDDSISAAQELFKQNFTSQERLCITGLEAGGTLVGIVINQKPEFFRAAVPSSPCMDLIGIDQNQPTTTIEEYGNPNVAKDLERLQKLSPLQSLKVGITEKDKQRFPSVFLTVNLNAANYASSYKYIAELQNLFCDKKRRPLPGKLHLIEIISRNDDAIEDNQYFEDSFQEKNDINFLIFICETFGISLDNRNKKIKRLIKYKRKISQSKQRL